MKHSVEEIKIGNTRGLLIDVPGSEVVRSQVWFNSGFRFAPKKKYEMPHITEHLLIGGNKDYPDSILFKKEIEKNGAYFNAHTSELVNYYDWECAEFEIDRILGLALPQLTKPLIQEKDVKMEKSRVNEELDGYISNHYSSLYSLTSSAFTGQPQLKERIDSLKIISAKDMNDYYLSTHTRQNATVFVAGNVKANKAKIVEGLTKILDGLPTGEKLTATPLEKAQLAKPVVESRDIPQLYYRVDFSAPATEPKQWAAASLLTDLLHSFLPSGLFGEVWEKGLAYGISVFFGWDHAETSFSVVNNVSPDNAMPLFELISKQLVNIKRGQVPPSELREVKDIARGTSKLKYQTASSILSFYAEDYVLFEDMFSTDEWLEMKMTVTTKDLANVADLLLTGGEWILGLLGAVGKVNPAELHKTLSEVRK